tara:strand:+ start:859 stop:1581 length:723 start_codon:yes stop_codon:yes gene_type:complete
LPLPAALPLLGKVAGAAMTVGKIGVKGAKKVATGAKNVATKVDDVAQNKKVQRVAAAKQQIDQQRQQAQQQKQQQQQRASEMARSKASTGDGAFGKAWDVLTKDRKSPEAMRHKREYDAAYNKRPDQIKYREELNRERRRRGIMGSHDHMDVSHTQGGRLTLEPEHSNRARHFKDKGTLRVVKSMKDDLELLRNLMQGPMDEQDKKIAEAAMTMIEEREGEEKEDKSFTRHSFGGSHMFL